MSCEPKKGSAEEEGGQNTLQVRFQVWRGDFMNHPGSAASNAFDPNTLGTKILLAYYPVKHFAERNASEEGDRACAIDGRVIPARTTAGEK
jgi:hypothetical protein